MIKPGWLSYGHCITVCKRRWADKDASILWIRFKKFLGLLPRHIEEAPGRESVFMVQ